MNFTLSAKFFPNQLIESIRMRSIPFDASHNSIAWKPFSAHKMRILVFLRNNVDRFLQYIVNGIIRRIDQVINMIDTFQLFIALFKLEISFR